ncbi:unnamed protein product [Bursaphelenchus okinawaensis]|uniref:ZP domain-containing protein n=1 Tax=Bursaphelenchus okinawaensis TaxID=465554 RepID=A0A811JS74_9BILA|nr:unnamed protein product [Bursaphelenchus okinawaensis]CAG9080500.1 unnamed protein product [Bursaphelenchus okinawaensis]
MGDTKRLVVTVCTLALFQVAVAKLGDKILSPTDVWITGRTPEYECLFPYFNSSEMNFNSSTCPGMNHYGVEFPTFYQLGPLDFKFYIEGAKANCTINITLEVNTCELSLHLNDTRRDRTNFEVHMNHTNIVMSVVESFPLIFVEKECEFDFESGETLNVTVYANNDDKGDCRVGLEDKYRLPFYIEYPETDFDTDPYSEEEALLNKYNEKHDDSLDVLFSPACTNKCLYALIAMAIFSVLFFILCCSALCCVRKVRNDIIGSSKTQKSKDSKASSKKSKKSSKKSQKSKKSKKSSKSKKSKKSKKSEKSKKSQKSGKSKKSKKDSQKSNKSKKDSQKSSKDEKSGFNTVSAYN